MNASVNCIDRHLKDNGQKTAIIWEGDDPKDSLKITYKDLHESVCKFANALKKRGINIKLEEVKKALKLRNISDKKRKHSPLKKHKNAVVVNTGKLSKKAMIRHMTNQVIKVLKNKYGH